MIKRLYLKNFRNYAEFNLDDLGKVNIFIGKNGQGKTNLLEAVFFLSMLRSFRTSQISDIKKIGSTGFYAGAELSSHSGYDRRIEAEYADKRKLMIEGSSVGKASEFVNQIRTVVFSPNDILLVNGSSSLRRRFIDMFISAVKPEYMTVLQDYYSAMQKRNAFLRIGENSKTIASAKAFEPILADKGVKIVCFRNEILSKLSSNIFGLMKDITGSEREFFLKYNVQRGTEIESEYLSRFDQERGRDFSRQYATFGPHLDDFEFIYAEKTLRNYGSTGQCRLASLCLKLACIKIMRYSGNEPEIVALVDDVTGELDLETKKAFYGVIKDADQVFFTFTEKPEGDEFLAGARIFEISEGQIIC
ncbi:MAG: DNA replication and repair protein RecF [Lentisphaerae bacterium]|nr:DNA replication and repair protein RecF [Lentisphaerota bacterium]